MSTRGFFGHRRSEVSDRVPPGQHVVQDFPVLSAGPTPKTRLEEWSFTIELDGERIGSWNWDEFLARHVFLCHTFISWGRDCRSDGGLHVGASARLGSIDIVLDGRGDCVMIAHIGRCIAHGSPSSLSVVSQAHRSFPTCKAHRRRTRCHRHSHRARLRALGPETDSRCSLSRRRHSRSWDRPN